MEHKDIIKIAAASQTERRGEERWPIKAYIWSLFLYMLTVFTYAHCF
jgi:hypothetical protein